MAKNIKISDGTSVNGARDVERIINSNQGTIFEVNFVLIADGGVPNTAYNAVFTTTRSTTTTFDTAFITAGVSTSEQLPLILPLLLKLHLLHLVVQQQHLIRLQKLPLKLLVILKPVEQLPLILPQHLILYLILL